MVGNKLIIIRYHVVYPFTSPCRIPSSNIDKTRTLTTGEVFLDAKEYFDLFDAISPIRPPARPVSTSTCLVRNNRPLQKPAVKRTLMHRAVPKKSNTTRMFNFFYVYSIFYIARF